MNDIDILEEDVKNILNCCTDIETLISLDERAKEDLKNNTHNIQQQEVLTIIREFIRCKNDCSNLIAENKELKEKNEGLKTKLDTLIEKYKELKEEKETDYTSVYLKGVYDERDKRQKKIKEMIEELKETADEDNMEDFVRIEILQSLLGKE